MQPDGKVIDNTLDLTKLNVSSLVEVNHIGAVFFNGPKTMYSGDPSSKILKIGFQRSQEAVRGCPPCAARLFHHSKLFAGVSDMFWMLSACSLQPGSLSGVDILLDFLQCIVESMQKYHEKH